MDDNLTAPLTEDEAWGVRDWAREKHSVLYFPPSFTGKTPEYVALMLRMDGYTSVKDRDVLKAAGRL